MKALRKKLLPLTLFGIAVTASLFSVRPAQAGYIVTLEEVGSNVVATGSGPINLTELPVPITVSTQSLINARRGDISTGVNGSFVRRRLHCSFDRTD